MIRTSTDDVQIGIVGLGYVGLPLAVCFGRKYRTVGFDIHGKRIAELAAGFDRTSEVGREDFAGAEHLQFSTNPENLAVCNFFIVTVPTPIDGSNRPDLTALEKASETVGSVMRSGAIVVYESTVYPGATEEVCVPILERVSGLKFNTDFFVGYSPERINPGDREHRLPTITKVTSGSTPQAADRIDRVYASIIAAGTHKVSSIRVAEAAKVIENIQRDVNIALVNELALLFKRMGIETREVLDAAGSKWNFHRYQPGLVGGHCIGVDPYYLTHKALTIGFHPEVILAGRRINDGMAQSVTHDIVSLMVKRRIPVGCSRLLVMGFTFKENCPDIRNTKVADLVSELSSFSGRLVVFDPHADPEEAAGSYGLEITNDWPEGPFDGIILAVRHKAFIEAGSGKLRSLLDPVKGFIYDIKGVLPIAESDARL